MSEIRDGSDTGTLTGAAVHDADGHMVKLCEVSSGGTITQPIGDCTASGTGATTLALVWNALDQLNTATRTGANAIAESYAYDDSGRRISKTSGATTTSYLYDGDDIHAEWSGSISGNPAAAYVYGAGIDEPLLRLTGATNGPGATQVAYMQDGLGSVVGTASATGTLTANQRFDAWGNKTSSSGTIPQYGYTGREPDATGMVFYRARYYHPGISRFASRDPMGMADSISGYAYVGNNPVNAIDPYGLLAQLTGTPMSANYWNMTADASGWLSGAVDSARQRLTDFASGVDVGGAVDQFGRKLANDFVQNNQGRFGAYGWMADQLAPYAQGYDGSSPNGQLAAVAAIGATLATPGGAAGKAKSAANGAEIIGTVEGRAIRSGDFSITDFANYPAGVPKPTTPVNLISGVEYAANRAAANSANRAIHRSDPSISPQQIHEVQPVRFGGSPTDAGNKVYLDRSLHQQVTNWWNDLQRYIQGLGQ